MCSSSRECRQSGHSSDSTSRAEPVTVPTFDVPYFRYIDDEGTEGEEEWSSSRSLSSIEEDSSTDSVKILEHLLSDLTLDNDQGTTQGKESAVMCHQSQNATKFEPVQVIRQT
uniref:Uncharacterized protein n=1 Tax=Scophthalmus maximus TaxID=52904 RepID=A0A8D3CKX0_SCOMX